MRPDRILFPEKTNFQINPIYKQKDLKIQSLDVRGKYFEIDEENKDKEYKKEH